MSQLGRIGGQVLTDNLLRAGVDLAFETDLLYLDVTNRKIGIRDSTPSYELDVNSGIKTTDLEATTQIDAGNLRLTSPNTFSTSVGGIAVRIAGSTIFHDRLATQVSGNGRLLLDGNAISSFSNQNIVFDPNGAGTVELQANTNITGNVDVSGNINVLGDLSGISSLTLGDQTIDTLTVNTDFTQSIIPGDDLTYALGADAADSSQRRWAQIYSPDWTNITSGLWPGSGIRPQTAVISDQLLLDGVNNKISGIQSNEDVLLNPDTGIVYIESLQFGVNPPFGVIQTFNNPNAYGTSADDTFGISVALTDSYAVIGAANEDDAGGTQSGKAYIYNLSTGTLLHTLTNPNAFDGSGFDFFGSAVAITDTYTVVGAPGETMIEVDNPDYALAGKAYIFNTVTGALLWTLDNPNSPFVQEDLFGGEVAISGNRVIIGALGYQGGNYSGRAYVFNAATGALLYTLSNPNTFGGTANDRFSNSVAISNSYIIVGAPNEDQLGVLNPGKAYIYNASTGALLFTLNNPNAYGTGFGDNFGTSVAITDSYAVVGAPNEDDAGGLNSGKVYIYNTSTGVLLRTLNNPNAYGISQLDSFGSSVALSGTRLIVGAPNEDDVDGTDSGKAYIFDVTTGTLLYTIDNANSYGTSAGDLFGGAVAISGSYALAAAGQEDDAGGTSSGKVYVIGQPALDQSIIKNLLNTPLIFTGTGIGYYNFTGTNAMVVPSGDNSQRRASPEVGETRWNTEVGYLECYDGSVWVISTGGGEEVTQQIMDDLSSVYTLIFG